MALSDEQSRGQALKRVIQKAVRAVGLHVGRYPPVDSLAYHLKTLLRELAIDCVLDVGAHEGEFAGFLRELDYTGEIISFEPVRSSFETLTRARSLDKDWRGQNVALGAEEGELEMNIYTGSVFNSFLKPADDGTARFRDNTQLVRVEKVPVRRLETVIDEILAARPSANIFLKMDTQGFDLQVVRGGGRRLESIRGLQTELAARSTYAGMPTLPEALSELDRLGFELTGIFPVARELDHLRVIEFDCVMCRKPKT
ncbi:MAG TPA: FkbM family methyltransferase [Kofleriaceae bacterium]|jgi:FkbM family methyltransferase|nr:FkbM family methyltransferase [Kofleriaceae bacterium]